MSESAGDYIRRLAAECRFLEMRSWHRFYLFLKSLNSDAPVPQPLILAANCASPARKLARLSEQLEWAERNSVYAEAAAYLDRLPADQWAQCGAERWGRESEGL